MDLERFELFDLMTARKRTTFHSICPRSYFPWLYTNSGRLLSLKVDLLSGQQIEFWNTFGTFSLGIASNPPKAFPMNRERFGANRNGSMALPRL